MHAHTNTHTWRDLLHALSLSHCNTHCSHKAFYILDLYYASRAKSSRARAGDPLSWAQRSALRALSDICRTFIMRHEKSPHEWRWLCVCVCVRVHGHWVGWGDVWEVGGYPRESRRRHKSITPGVCAQQPQFICGEIRASVLATPRARARARVFVLHSTR